jgi:hypothetical protein
MLSALTHMQYAKLLTGFSVVHYASLLQACWTNAHGVHSLSHVKWILLWISTAIYLYMALESFLDFGCFLSFLLLYAVGRTPWTVDQPVARPLPTHGTTPKQNIRTQTSMPCVGFEPTIPAFERAKTVHASDRATTVIGGQYRWKSKFTDKL